MGIRPRQSSGATFAFKATDIDGDVEIEHDDGNVDLRSIRGKITSDSTDGNFRASDIDGDVEIEHDDGNVDLKSIRSKITSNSTDENFRASDIDGDLEIKHDDGNVDLNDITGKVRCGSTDGKFEARDVDSDVMEIEHDDGEVILKNVRGRITCTNDRGDTKLDGVNGPLDLHYSRGNARIVASDPLEGSWQIEGGQGDCYLILPAKAGVSLSLDTHEGKIKAGWPIEVERERSHESAKAERNGGGTPIMIKVERGNINID